MTDIVITSAKRTPIGKFLGSLSNFSASELGKFAIDSVIEECKLDKNSIDEVIMGQVLTGGAGQNPARQASMLAGVNVSLDIGAINSVTAGAGGGLLRVNMNGNVFG